MSNVPALRNTKALPSADEPLPNSENQRGLTLLRNWTVATEAMNDPNDRARIIAVTDELRRSLEPADARTIAAHLESLAVMYPQQGRMDADDRIRARAWLADLAEYPADVIEAACVAWRRSDTPFMPSPGQLIAKIKPIVSHRKRLFKRGEDLQNDAGLRSAKTAHGVSERGKADHA